MKEFNMLVWLTQLGLGVALPLAGLTLLALWLRQEFGLGNWVIFAGLGLGLVFAVDSFFSSLKILEKMDRKNSSEKEKPVSFNEHE